jgi:cobalamin biosynthetic protein CobC
MEPPLDLAPLAHGGDLDAARKLFPGAPEPFIDLSTGINPHPYPLPQLPSDLFAKLPQIEAIARLARAAAEAYGAPSPAYVVAAPGSQILVAQTGFLLARGRASILAPTYAEHGRVAALAGHNVVEVAEIGQLAEARIAIVVNPNNPDGRLIPKETLLALADRLRRRGGLLLVDESFMDVGPEDASLGEYVEEGNIVVLRSFGKFYGLPGLRLSFALAAPNIAAHLAAALGPWPVSTAALAVGTEALEDAPWRGAARKALAESAGRLDELLARAGLSPTGGTSLFRLVRTQEAERWFHALGRAGVLVRRFNEHPSWLRFGLPGGESEWDRLAAALAV